LECGEVLFPPKILLKLRPERGHEVVGVHDDVNDGVHEAAKALLASRKPSGKAIAEHGHDTMMNYLNKLNFKHLYVYIYF